MQKFVFNLIDCEVSSRAGLFVLETSEEIIKPEHISHKMPNFVEIFYKSLTEFNEMGTESLSNSDLWAIADAMNYFLDAVNTETSRRDAEEDEKQAESIRKDEDIMCRNQWVGIRGL